MLGSYLHPCAWAIGIKTIKLVEGYGIGEKLKFRLLLRNRRNLRFIQFIFECVNINSVYDLSREVVPCFCYPEVKGVVLDTPHSDMDFYSDKTYDLEVSLFDQQQRSRHNDLEIHGIPDAINDTELEKTVIKIINDNKLVDDKLENYEIEACHRLPSKKIFPDYEFDKL